MIMKTSLFTIMFLCCCLFAAAQTKYEVTANTFLNIRSYADANAPVLGTVDKGGKLDVYEISNGWAKIAYDGGYAYVSSAYLKKVQNVSSDVATSNNKSFDFSSWNFSRGGAEWMAYVIGGLSLVLFFIRKIRGDSPLNDSGSLYMINWILFLIVAILELVYVTIMGSDSIWFCIPDKVGWLWTIVDFFVFGFIVYNQFMCFFNTLDDTSYNSYGSFDRRWGIYSWAGVVVGGIISGIFFPAALPFVLLAFVICQIIQIVQIFKGVLPHGGLGYAFLCTAVYLLGSLSTIMILAHFVVLLIIVLVGYLILSFISASNKGSSRECCETCNHYSCGYCDYRDEHIYNAGNKVCSNYS